TSVFSSHKLQTCGSLVSSIARELIPSLLMAMNYISGPTHQPNNHKVAPHQRYGIKLKTKPHILLHLHTYIPAPNRIGLDPVSSRPLPAFGNHQITSFLCERDHENIRHV